MKLVSAIVKGAIICLSISFNVSANSLRVAYVDAPPYSYQDAERNAQGMLIDAYREIILAIGKQPEFIYLPHRRQIDFIEKGKVDTWAGQKNSQVNDDLFLVSESPLFLMEMQVYWKEGSQSIDNLIDLKGKSIILISSYSYGGNHETLAKKSKQAIYVINHEEGFDKLLSSDDYYLLGYKKISDSVINKFSLENVNRASLATYHLHLKLAKKYPKSVDVMNRIDTQLRIMSSNNPP